MKLTAQHMHKAFECLDRKLDHTVRLIVGGGGAMLLAHHFPLSTSDIDAVPTAGVDLAELDHAVKEVAAELSLPVDWLNPYFSSFAHVLPPDYGTRLIEICSLSRLSVLALGKEDLLIMKCFAARQKDVVHARALVKRKANLELVRQRIEELLAKRIPGSEKALRFFKEIEDFFSDTED